MKSFFKNLSRSKKPSLVSGLEPTTTTITSAADPTSFPPAGSAKTAGVQGTQASSRLAVSVQPSPSHHTSTIIVVDQTAHELQLSTSVSALAVEDIAPGAHLEDKSPSSPDATIQANLGSTKSEQNRLASCLLCRQLNF